MEYLGIIITAVLGACTSSLTWFLGRRKYNSEVDQNNIRNMQESLDFYVKLSDDYKQRLTEEIESHNKEVDELKRENSELKKEIRNQEKKYDEQIAALHKEISMMKNQMLSVYGQVCLNFNCIERNSMKSFKRSPKPKSKKAITDEKIQIPETTD